MKTTTKLAFRVNGQPVVSITEKYSCGIVVEKRYTKSTQGNLWFDENNSQVPVTQAKELLEFYYKGYTYG